MSRHDSANQLRIFVASTSPDNFVACEQAFPESKDAPRLVLHCESDETKIVRALQRNAYDAYILDTESGYPIDNLLQSAQAAADNLPLILVGELDVKSLPTINPRRLASMDQLSKAELDGVLLERVIRHAIERSNLHNKLLQSEARANYQETHDPLTGLANRSNLLTQIAHESTKRAKPVPHQYAVIVIDFDRFKAINKSLGQNVGDRLIKEAARRLKASIPMYDVLARTGGDEFAILAHDCDDPAEIESFARSLQERCSQPFQIGHFTLRLSASLGLAICLANRESPDDALRNAITAMSEAKSERQGGYAVFGSEMRNRAQRLFDLESELRVAIERNEFEVFYQPIYKVESSTLFGAEALVRWRHPRYGLVSPVEFIPIAEETGLITDIGRLVLNEAADQFAKWNSERAPENSLAVSVNVSSVQFAKADIIGDVRHALKESGLSARNLRIEITESLLMEDMDSTADILRQLRALGCPVDLDDFGTGYSSLSYLADLPVSRLKIDRIFVNAITESSGRAKIAQAIVSLAHSLDLDVTAEGVETEQQFSVLKLLGCQHVQGYLFAPPIPADKFEELWRERACA